MPSPCPRRRADAPKRWRARVRLAAGFGVLLILRIFAPKNRTIAENLYIY